MPGRPSADRAVVTADADHAGEREGSAIEHRHHECTAGVASRGEGRRPREPMDACRNRINRNLERMGINLRVVGSYRNTGNLVLETANP